MSNEQSEKLEASGQEPANSETPAAPPQSKESVDDTRSADPVGVGISVAVPRQCSLEIEAAKAADPFFSGRKHFPALDGLRGIAILLVLADHYAWVAFGFRRSTGWLAPVFAKGWCGVDLFFVLSGLLITGILVDSRGQEYFFRNFYARRFLRIFPLYYGFLGVMLAILLVLRLKSGADFYRHAVRADLWSYQPWLWTYTQNIWMAIHNRGMNLVPQLWTLSVEEQFYLFWPLVVLALDRRQLVTACVALMLLAPAFRLAALEAGARWVAIYMLTPFRVDSFAAGALVALAVRGPLPSRRALALARVAVAAVGAILAGMLAATAIHGWTWHPDAEWFTRGGPKDWFPGGLVTAALVYSVLASFFSLTLYLVLNSDGVAGTICRHRYLRFFGKYSYGIYVLHYPILTVTIAAAGRTGLLTLTHNSFLAAATLVALNTGLTVAAAMVSYHLYEKHFLKLKKYFPERATAAVPPQ